MSQLEQRGIAESATREIPLAPKSKTQAGVYTALVDEVDYEACSKVAWSLIKSTNAMYAVNRSVNRLMHRYIMERTIERDLEQHEEVDHINGNTFDNRRSNLRIATRSQNAANRDISKKSTTKLKGAYYHKKSRKYQSYIMKEGVYYRLGSFATAQEAHEAYCKKAVELFGEFANFGSNHDS